MLGSFLDSARNSARRRASASKRSVAVHSVIQPLEGRRMLSITQDPTSFVVTVDESANNGNVQITIAAGSSSQIVVTDSAFDGGAPQAFNNVPSVQVDAGNGNDSVTISATLPSTTDSSSTDNTIQLGNGNDTVVGSPGRDYVIAGTGADSILGGAGNDLIRVGLNPGAGVTPGADTIYGGQGDDDIVVAGGNGTNLHGGMGDDSVSAPIGSGDTQIFGGMGDDFLTATGGNDTVTTGLGFDSVQGGSGLDFITAGAGNDTVAAGTGDTYVITGDGNDSVQGGPGNDTILAGAGNDTVGSGAGNSIVAVGDKDRLQFSGNPAFAAPGHSQITLGVGSDTVVTGGAGDTVTASTTSDLPHLFVDNSTSDVITGYTPSRGDVESSNNTYNTSGTLTEDLTINLTIKIDGQTVAIPSNAGAQTAANSVAQVTAENSNGSVTVAYKSTASTPPTYTLGKFFKQWGTTFNAKHIAQYLADGQNAQLVMTVTHSNGSTETLTSGYKGYLVQQGDSIVINYELT